MPYVTRRYRRTRRPARRSPRKSTYRKAASRRSTRPRRGGGKKALSLRSKWENPVHQAGLYKLRFCDTNFSVSTLAAAAYRGVYVFSGNSPFDPDVTGVGVQPYGFDQLCGGTTFYQTYRVSGSSIRVRLHPPAEYNGEIRVILIPYRTTVTETDPADVMVMPHVKMIRYSPVQGARYSTVTNYVTSRYMFSDFDSTDAECASAYNTNPAQRWYWNVWIDTAGSSSEETIYFDVDVVYYTKLARYNYILQES